MTKIRYGLTVLAVCAGLLWAGIAEAQPSPPPGVGNDTDTNAATECGTGELLDGDGNCIAITDLSDIQAQLDDLTARVTGSGLVFVTSTTHNGNLGGVAGADAICNARAAAAGLPGSYLAWISMADDDPEFRFFQYFV